MWYAGYILWKITFQFAKLVPGLPGYQVPLSVPGFPLGDPGGGTITHLHNRVSTQLQIKGIETFHKWLRI